MNHRPQILAGLLCWLMTLSASAAEIVGQAIQSSLEGQRQAILSQQRVDNLAGESVDLADEYRLLLRHEEQLKAYNDQLEGLVDQQKALLATYNEDAATALQTRARSLPLLREMLRTLEEFVKLDLPFLPQERAMRLEQLKLVVDSPEASLAEKFRRLYESYQIEADYGHSVEATSETLMLEGMARTVDVLRIGRTALFYLSFDHTSAGYWDQRSRAWRELSGEVVRELAGSFQVVRKQRPQAMMVLPLSTASTSP